MTIFYGKGKNEQDITVDKQVIPVKFLAFLYIMGPVNQL